MLIDGFYLMISVKEQGLEPVINKIHNVLIYGYDNTIDHFAIIGYEDEDNYKESYLIGDELLQKIHNTDNKIVTFHFMKVNDEARPKFDSVSCINNIHNYVNSINDTFHQNAVFGLKSLEMLNQYITTMLTHGHRINERYITILLEHKKLMFQRLQYMFSLQIIRIEIVEKYKFIFQEVCSLSKIIREYNSGALNTDSTKIFAWLNQIIKREKEILAEIVSDKSFIFI